MANSDTMTKANSGDDAKPSIGWAKRILFISLGLLFVGIGYVGMLLPGIPTVGPLLLASFFFARSSPYLENKLIRNRFFAPILPYLDGEKEMPFKARLASIALMWLSILISVWICLSSDVGGVWVPALIVIAGMIGTVFILRFGKKRTKHSQDRDIIGNRFRGLNRDGVADCNLCMPNSEQKIADSK